MRSVVSGASGQHGRGEGRLSVYSERTLAYHLEPVLQRHRVKEMAEVNPCNCRITKPAVHFRFMIRGSLWRGPATISRPVGIGSFSLRSCTPIQQAAPSASAFSCSSLTSSVGVGIFGSDKPVPSFCNCENPSLSQK